MKFVQEFGEINKKVGGNWKGNATVIGIFGKLEFFQLFWILWNFWFAEKLKKLKWVIDFRNVWLPLIRSELMFNGFPTP